MTIPLDQPKTSGFITLVIGASRGIGREYVNQLSQDPEHQVYATVRKPTDFRPANVTSILLDVSYPGSIESAAKQVPEVDILIINAAVFGLENILTISDDRIQEFCDVNILGPMRVMRVFIPALRARKTRQIILLLSESGSFIYQLGKQNPWMSRGLYPVSKAAGHMIVVQLHYELHDEGFTVIVLDPGWVATDMGNMIGPGGMSASKSVKSQLEVIRNLATTSSAKFHNWDGRILQ